MGARDMGMMQGPAQICFWTWLGSHWDGVGLQGIALAACACSEKFALRLYDHAMMEGTHCMTQIVQEDGG